MPEKTEEEKKLDLFKAFGGSIHGSAYLKAQEQRLLLGRIKVYYDTDDIFRREIDHLKEKMKKDLKKGKPVKETDDLVLELLKEAEYRRFIASFENMKANYESRKKEMSKIKAVFS